MTVVDLIIEPDGTLWYVHSDTLESVFGLGDVRRASRVEPAATWCPVHHREGGTDTPCAGCPSAGTGWMVDLHLSGGPVQAGFATRAEALAWEHDWVCDAMARGALPGQREAAAAQA